MLELGEAIYKYLTGLSGLSALVADRVYPDTLPQNPEYPAVTFRQISEDEVEPFVMPSTTMICAVYQMDCWGATRAGADAVAKQVRAAWKNYSGVMGGVGGVTVNAVRKISRLDNYYTDTDGRPIAYAVSMDFEIWHQEVA